MDWDKIDFRNEKVKKLRERERSIDRAEEAHEKAILRDLPSDIANKYEKQLKKNYFGKRR